MSEQQTVTLEIKTPETSTPEANNSSEETASEAVAAAQAAVALANTVAANAEVQAAAEISETKEDWEARWNELKIQVSTLAAGMETLSAQVQSLSSRQTASEEEIAEVSEAVEAEEILTPPPHTEENQTEPRDKSEDESQEQTTPLVPEKLKRVFRL